MNVWNGLLESLHSALIDELTERHPKPKPTLGLPLRYREFAAPPTAERLLMAEVTFETGRGQAMLAFQNGFFQRLKISATEFWAAILKRAQTEFARRGITPRIAPPAEQDASQPVASAAAGATRIIWIPLEIPGGLCWLGVGM